MKKTKKFIIILFISITILLLFSTIVRADIGINTEDYKTRVTTTENGEGLKVVGTILGIVRNLGVIASVLAIALIGLKYMLGSLEEKANYKENMILYITGCFLLVACTTLPNVIYNLSANKNEETLSEYQGMVWVTFNLSSSQQTSRLGYPGEELQPPYNIDTENFTFAFWVTYLEIEQNGDDTYDYSYHPVPTPIRFPDTDTTYTAFYYSKDPDDNKVYIPYNGMLVGFDEIVH